MHTALKEVNEIKAVAFLFDCRTVPLEISKRNQRKMPRVKKVNVFYPVFIQNFTPEGKLASPFFLEQV